MDHSEVTHSGLKPYSSLQGFNPELAITHDSLFDLILKFNLFPALYVHESWTQSLSFLQDKDEPKQELTPYWMRFLSSTLLEAHQLNREWEFDFANPVKKLVLIDSENLLRLGHYVAAILIQPYLRKTIAGNKISIINQVIGATNREFALRWKPISRNGFSLDITHLSLLTEMAYKAMASGRDWQNFIVRLIISLLPSEARALRNRLILKFPIEFRDADYFQLVEDKRVLVAALFFDVIQQQLPDWQKRLELKNLSSPHGE